MSAFSESAKVKLIYIHGKNTSRQDVIYEGSMIGFKNNLSVQVFNGFDNDQHFTLVDEEVKILNKIEVINSESLITNVIYYAGPEYLDADEVVF